MKTEIDALTIKDLEARYGVARSNIYNRIDGLKQKGYAMEPEKQNRRSIYNAEQIVLMDALDRHLKAGNEIKTFAAAEGHLDVSYPLQDRAELSYRTQDADRFNSVSMALNLASVIEAIASKMVDLTTLQHHQQSAADPLANLDALERAYQNG